MHLVFHYGALGDFVLTWPMLRRLGGGITLVTDWHRATLASKLIAGVRPMDIHLWEFVRLHSEGGPTSVSPAVGELFEQAESVISFISTGEDDWAKNVARLAPQAKRVYVDTRPGEAVGEHVTDWHAEQIEAQGVALGDPIDVALVSRDGPTVVHPGSGGEAKCWPRERYERLIERLVEQGQSVAPLLGETEVDRWPGDVVARWEEVYGARVFGSLDGLYEALSSAGAYVGNDSGPTHLAAQMGLPTVALFGPTAPEVWRPVGPGVTVLAPDTPGGMDWLGVDAVLDAVRKPG